MEHSVFVIMQDRWVALSFYCRLTSGCSTLKAFIVGCCIFQTLAVATESSVEHVFQ